MYSDSNWGLHLEWPPYGQMKLEHCMEFLLYVINLGDMFRVLGMAIFSVWTFTRPVPFLMGRRIPVLNGGK